MPVLRTLSIVGLLVANLATAAESPRPNVLFIAVDDLNGWVGALQGHPQVNRSLTTPTAWLPKENWTLNPE